MDNNLEQLDSRVFMIHNFLSEELNSINIKMKNLKEWLKDNPSVSLLKRVDKNNGSVYFVLQENYSKNPKQKVVKDENINAVQNRIEEFKLKRKKIRDESNRLKDLKKGMERMLNYSIRVFNIKEQ